MALDLFREAVKAAHNGDQPLAHQLLQELVIGQPRHEMGWLWLSKVSEDLEEQIYALETVLTLNPACEEALFRLPELKSQQKQQTPVIDLYQEAVTAYKNGRPHQARQHLQQLVRTEPSNTRAWIALGRLAQTSAEKVVAMEAIVDINPQNEKAAATLKKLKLNHDDYLALGQAYHTVGQANKALTAYQYAAKHAASSVDRHIARKHVNDLKAQLESPKVGSDESQAQQPSPPLKLTSDTETLLRLAAGPVIIFGLLLFIHGGLNPLKIPFTLYLSTLGVGVGSLLVAGAANTPHHRFWQQMLGPEGIKDSPTRYMMTTLGLLLILIPYGIVLIASFNRLVTYQAALSATLQ